MGEERIVTGREPERAGNTGVEPLFGEETINVEIDEMTEALPDPEPPGPYIKRIGRISAPPNLCQSGGLT